MKLTTICVTVLMALGTASAVAAGVRTITVDAQGVGPTREKAITAALAEAISRVNGVSVSSRDVSNLNVAVESVTKSDGNDKHTSTESKTEAALAEDVQRQTKTQTQGLVKSYQVVSVDCKAGECRATLSVDVNKYESNANTTRSRIAVLPFRLKGAQQDLFGSQLNQSLVDYLTGTRHFAVLDRDYQKERLEELAGLLRDDVNFDDRARIGNSLGTDYIVTGTVEELSTKSIERKVPYTNELVREHQMKVVVNWRVIEASSGQVMVSNTVAQTLRTKPGATESADTSDSGYAGREVGRSIGVSINDIIYPTLVLSYHKADNTVTLGQGGSTMTPGTEYRLVKYGALVEDPYTGEKNAREEIDVGFVKVTRVTPKLAYAKVLEANIDLEGAAPREYILRPIVKGGGPQKNAAPAKTMTPAW